MQKNMTKRSLNLSLQPDTLDFDDHSLGHDTPRRHISDSFAACRLEERQASKSLRYPSSGRKDRLTVTTVPRQAFSVGWRPAPVKVCQSSEWVIWAERPLPYRRFRDENGSAVPPPIHPNCSRCRSDHPEPVWRHAEHEASPVVPANANLDELGHFVQPVHRALRAGRDWAGSSGISISSMRSPIFTMTVTPSFLRCIRVTGGFHWVRR